MTCYCVSVFILFGIVSLEDPYLVKKLLLFWLFSFGFQICSFSLYVFFEWRPSLCCSKSNWYLRALLCAQTGVEVNFRGSATACKFCCKHESAYAWFKNVLNWLKNWWLSQCCMNLVYKCIKMRVKGWKNTKGISGGFFVKFFVKRGGAGEDMIGMHAFIFFSRERERQTKEDEQGKNNNERKWRKGRVK